jgi:heptosyltransferase-2
LAGKRILVVQIAGMGDLTLAVPAIRAIRQSNPSGGLDLLTSEKGRRAAEGCPYIDTIESIDLNPSPEQGVPPSAGMGKFLPLLRKIHRRYDIAINLMGLYSPQGAVRMGFFLRFLGVSTIAGRNTLGTGTFYHCAITEDLAVPRNERDSHLDLVRHLGADNGAGDDLEAWPTADDERTAESLLKNLPGQGPVIVLNPGTDRQEKNWPEERFLEIMRTLRTEKEARFLLAGGPAEADLTERLAEAVAPYALNTVGKISYQGTTVLMRRCDMVLTSDTAALHLAWAAGAAGVALFRKENLGRYRPATEKIICLAGEDTGEEVSLEISVDEVTRACLECLDRQELAG